MQFPIVETDCTIHAPDGTPFTAHGAIFDLAKGGSLYVGAITPEQHTGKYRQDGRTGRLETWHGERVGWYRVTSSWRVNNYPGFPYYMESLYAVIGGREYKGRYSPDRGNLVNLRPRKTA